MTEILLIGLGASLGGSLALDLDADLEKMGPIWLANRNFIH